MSSLILTDVGKSQIALKHSAGQPLLLRKIAFSADLNAPDPTWTGLPGEYAVQYDLSHVAKLPDEDAVLYSATLDQSIGDFTISLIGYYDDTGVLVLVDQIPPFDKKSNMGGGLANVFRHNAVIDYQRALNAMPIHLPLSQFHPEPKKMLTMNAEMGVMLDTAITSSETFLLEVPRIDARIERLEGRSIVIADAVEQSLREVQGNQTRLQTLETQAQQHTNDLNNQIKSVVVDGQVLYGPLINFEGTGLAIDQANNKITFSVPEDAQGVVIDFDGLANPTRFKQLNLVTDEFIKISSNTAEQLMLEINPERLRAFGNLSVADGEELTTLNADGLDTTLNLIAGRGINFGADDVLNTLTVSTDDLQGFQRVIINNDQVTTTLSSEDSASFRLFAGDNIDLQTNSETNSITLNSQSFGSVLVRALNPQNDASLNAGNQHTLAFEESETVRIGLVGYGQGSQAIKFETSFPEVINDSFEIVGGNLRVDKDANEVGGHVYCEQLFCAGEITGFSTVSDQRLKEQIEPLQDSLNLLSQLNGYRFRWVETMPQYGGKQDLGLLAQEVEKVVPEAIYETEWVGEEGLIKTIRYERLVPLLIESIKALQARVEVLEELKRK